MSTTAPRDLAPFCLRFVAAAQEAGHEVTTDLNGQRRTGVGLVQSNIRDGQRHSVVAGYLEPAAGRENLTLAAGCHVTAVLLEGRRAVRVRVRTADGRDREVLARRTVVLAAGALRTPQLLMLSGIGPADHLREHGIDVVLDAPGVGADLQDHPIVLPVWPVVDGTPMVGPPGQDEQRSYALLRRGRLSSAATVAVVIPLERPEGGADVQLFLPLVGVGEGDVPVLEEPAVSCGVVLTPRSRGTVGLASSNPPDAPRIDPRDLKDPADLARVHEGMRLAGEVMAAPSLRGCTPRRSHPPAEADDEAVDAWVGANLTTLSHPVGTCRTGVDPAAAVDPATMLVHGLENLAVVDASVMPTLTRGTTHAPVIMIAERAAEVLRR